MISYAYENIDFPGRSPRRAGSKQSSSRGTERQRLYRSHPRRCAETPGDPSGSTLQPGDGRGARVPTLRSIWIVHAHFLSPRTRLATESQKATPDARPRRQRPHLRPPRGLDRGPRSLRQVVDRACHRTRTVCSLGPVALSTGPKRHEPASVSNPLDSRPGLRVCRGARATTPIESDRTRARTSGDPRGSLSAGRSVRQTGGRCPTRSGGHRARLHFGDHRCRLRSVSRSPLATSTAGAVGERFIPSRAPSRGAPTSGRSWESV